MKKAQFLQKGHINNKVEYNVQKGLNPHKKNIYTIAKS